MKNELKNLFLIGIGAAALTKKKAEETVKAFVKKGAINRNQAKEILNRVMREAGKAKSKLKKEGIKEVNRVKRTISKARKQVRKKAANKARKVIKRIIRR